MAHCVTLILAELLKVMLRGIPGYWNMELNVPEAVTLRVTIQCPEAQVPALDPVHETGEVKVPRLSHWQVSLGAGVSWRPE